ncbi:MAG: PQQ-dependent dehydrogenase, methanol/ethanol family [Bacteroidota bacterium]
MLLRKSVYKAIICLGLSCIFFACKPPAPPKGSPEHIKAVTEAIDDAALDNPDAKNWLNYGLNNEENRYSTLKAINTENVKDLGLAWSYELGSIRGVESTPIVVDGIMYVTGPWSIVHAVNVRTGKQIWTYDPKVPKHTAQKACCDVVNRGVAVYKGKVFVAALDGRLIALNAVSGDKEWEVVTLDQTKNYTITGAPRVIKGNVLIGNGGAEYGVRGFITAYDAETGEQKWRFYSVPGNPEEAYENEAMKMAAETWDPAGKYWEVGGGGTMWDAMAYDPELNLMYVGVGNGSPWNRRLRSPGGGDNLFLSSIVALNPDNGEYVWHYQTTPGDHWDYTATQHLILADLNIEGKDRKVIMQAPKNGFYFVIDRTDGSFISAKNYVAVNWATGYDENGRPMEITEAEYKNGAYEAIPGPYGAHNWHPMAFNPETGLTYIPAQGVPIVIETNDDWVAQGTAGGGPHNLLGWNLGVLASAVPPQGPVFGHLLAWDPVKQEAKWKIDHISPWNGGVLTTAGNLIFQGTADGRFVAYNAETGDKLWESPTGTGVIAAPSTYEVDGEQYVSIAAGWGGVYGLAAAHSETQTSGKVYTFKIGAKGALPEFAPAPSKPLVSGIAYKPEDIPMGGKLYINGCVFCHGVPGVAQGGAIPNLAYSDKTTIENLEKFVLTDALAAKGMPNFAGKLKEEDITKIQAFILLMSDQTKAALAGATASVE